METPEEFAKRIERQAADCECVECMRPLIEARDTAVALAAKRELLEEIRVEATRIIREDGNMRFSEAESKAFKRAYSEYTKAEGAG
jgi:hypothetical protein